MFTKKTLRRMYPGERKVAQVCNSMELEVKRLKRLLPAIHDAEMARVALGNVEAARVAKLADHGPGCDDPLNCTCELTQGTNTWPDGGETIVDHLAQSKESDKLTFPVQMTQEQYEVWVADER